MSASSQGTHLSSNLGPKWHPEQEHLLSQIRVSYYWWDFAQLLQVSEVRPQHILCFTTETIKWAQSFDSLYANLFTQKLHVTKQQTPNCKATVIATELVHDFSNTQPLLPALGSQHQPCGFRWNLPMQRQGFGIHRLRDPPSAFLGTSPKDGFMQFIKFYNTTNATTMIVGVISRVASNTNSQQQPMLSANICTSGTYKHYICSTNLKY